MDEATKAFFRKQQQDPDNQVCIDCGTAGPQWASVSHGCYISLEASGVHRSLGVHISFVRSTSMDSWKPIQLKLMELGGNKRLKEFFRKHNIPDDMPIAEKYNTRAAEWYRRNLRAIAEGNEPPPPLPEGTGHLPVNDTPTTTQIAFAKAAQSGMMSAGGAFASDTRHYGGYHGGGASPPTDSSPSVARRMDGFGSGGAAPPKSTGNSDGDFFASLLGADVGSKVSSGVWSTVGLVGSLANKAKSFAEEKVAQAQQEGLIDAVLDTAKQGVGAAVSTTTWAAQKGVEVTKATVTMVNEGGGKAVIGKTSEVVGTAAKKSISILGSGADWFSEQLGGGNDNASGLQNLSTGRMQGFGSDCPPSSSGPTTSSPSRSYQDPSRQEERKSEASFSSSGGSPIRGNSGSPAASPPAAKTPSDKADLWNDDDWGAWK